MARKIGVIGVILFLFLILPDQIIFALSRSDLDNICNDIYNRGWLRYGHRAVDNILPLPRYLPGIGFISEISGEYQGKRLTFYKRHVVLYKNLTGLKLASMGYHTPIFDALNYPDVFGRVQAEVRNILRLKNIENEILKLGFKNACYIQYLRAKQNLMIEVMDRTKGLEKHKVSINNALMEIWGIEPGSEGRLFPTPYYQILNKIRNELKQVYGGNYLDVIKNKVTSDSNLKKCWDQLQIATIQAHQAASLNEVQKNLASFWNKNNVYKETDVNNFVTSVNYLENYLNNTLSQEADKLQDNFYEQGAKIDQFLASLDLNICTTAIQVSRQNSNQSIKFNDTLREILSITLKPATITVTTTEVSIAVLPPVIFTGRHEGTTSLAEITPERIFNEIKDFLFKLAPTLFILLIVVGAIFYLISPINLQNIQTGSEYIKWAIIGYFLLLVVTGIISAVRIIFGGP
jgi:hypothetical protein